MIFLAAAWFFFFRDGEEDSFSYRTAAVERGPIIGAVATSGTLNAVITVQVGSQVSGQIKELLADFNSEVQAGQVIARIDPETFEAKVRQARAELDVARANVNIQRAGIERAQKELANAISSMNSARARTEKARVTLVNAKRNLERRRALFQSGSVSESQIDDAQTTHDQAQAQLNSDEADERAAQSLVATREAALKTARAQVDYAIEQVRHKEAALSQTEIVLEHTFIRSPVDGVVIERAVDIGQTVAASLQAPKLFVIAQDLRHMQVETDVDEADIGRVHAGQENDFWIRNQAEALESRAESSRTMSLLLAAVASVSLMVGGIGIMNIMIVSVTERTRKIGLRMAVGARKRDILMQFLTEAVALSMIGGLIGILLGVAGSMVFSAIGDWPAILQPSAIGIAFTVSAAVGIFFGFYPARKASRLDPIDALRRE